MVSIIIPVWNLWHMTEACLKSIAKVCSSDGLSEQVEVIVVDNHSTDDTVNNLKPTLIKYFGSKGHRLRMPANLGFAKACNIGAKVATKNLLLFLNNDTILLEGCIEPLIQTLNNHPKIGIVGPILMYPDNTVQHAGICFDPLYTVSHMYSGLPAQYVKSLKPRFWQAITGAAMLMSAKLFEQCNGFHEGYVNGYEDIDLCCQVRSNGLLAHVVNNSCIYHLESQTPGRFKNDEANASLLTKRFPDGFFPDQHTIALKNNLQPILGPDLNLYIDIPEASSDVLTQMFNKSFNLERCQIRLQDNPYWLNGYRLIANYYQDQEQWDEALKYYFKVLELTMLPKDFIAFRNCATIAKKKDQWEIYQQDFFLLQERMKDKETLLLKANAINRQAIKRDDQSLVRIVKQWMSTYHNEN